MADSSSDSSGSSGRDKPAPTEFPAREQFDSSSFPCPRCSNIMSAEYYGPCEICVSQLRDSQRLDGQSDQVAAEYEPKMNVTPNAVALKDD